MRVTRRRDQCRTSSALRRARMAMPDGQHPPAFALVDRCQQHHVRYPAQVAQVEVAGVHSAVGIDHSAAIDHEQHVEVLDRHVTDELTAAAPRDGGVDRDDGLGAALAGHARGECHRTLLGDGDIEIAAGRFLAGAHSAGALALCPACASACPGHDRSACPPVSCRTARSRDSCGSGGMPCVPSSPDPGRRSRPDRVRRCRATGHSASFRAFSCRIA